jgi:hypothetical protein
MTKTFDCIEMKRRAQEKIFEQIKDLTLEEELRYWAKQSEVLRAQIREAKKQNQVLE